MKKLIWLAAIPVVFVIFMAWYIAGEKSASSIDSFEECAAAGYPIMESYPEQCAVPGGQTFTKQY